MIKTMSLTREKILMLNDDDDDDDNYNFNFNNNNSNNDNSDLYDGYNDYNPILDTKNLPNDKEFRQTLSKSGYGRQLQQQQQQRQTIQSRSMLRSTGFRTGMISGSAMKSRGTAGGGDGFRTAGLRTGSTGYGRPPTAVRGAGYQSSQSSNSRLFDPLGLANLSTGDNAGGVGQKSKFHLQDESTPEWKIKHLEKQINKLLDESIYQAQRRRDFNYALDLAKDCVAKERSLHRLKEQSGLMETYGTNSDLTLATMFNLAERYSDAKLWQESIQTYQAILKNRSFVNTGRFRINIGEIYYRQKNYLKAIKFFRMALDQLSQQQQQELRLHLMSNIGLSFIRLQQYSDAIAAFEFILNERGDWNDHDTIFHLILSYYAIGNSDKMKYYFNKLLQIKIDDQFDERYGHHEILTNGGLIFSNTNTADNFNRSTDSNSDLINDQQSSQQRGPSSPILLIKDEQDHFHNLLIEAIRNDRLRNHEKKIIQHVEWCILTSAKLISPFIDIDYDFNRNNSNNLLSQFNNNEFNQINNGGLIGGEQSSSTTNITKMNGYDWCLEQIHRMASITSTQSFGTNYGINFDHLADELELYKATKQLRSREFDQAIMTLKSFESKDRLLRMKSATNATTATTTSIDDPITTNRLSSAAKTAGAAAATVVTPTTTRISSAISKVTATAATNLSFLYLLQNSHEQALHYANEAIKIDRYCLGALINKGNYYYYKENYLQAIELYQEAIINNSTILEAYYNLALSERKLKNFNQALDALYRLRSIIRLPKSSSNLLNQKIINTIEVNLMYQIGMIYESMNNIDQAKDFYQKVLHLVPTDIGLLIKMADIAADENDRQQSLQYLLESYRYLPSNISTIERLAAYYIEMKMYDQTIKYLEQLSIIQPNQIKWQLMIAASYRRSGNYLQSLSTYQSIHQRFPDNIDCLKFLIRLCNELETNEPNTSTYGQLIEKYTERLKRLEKTKELRDEQKLTSSRSASRTSTSGGINRVNTASGTSIQSREGSAATTSSNGSNSSSGYASKSITSAKSSPKLLIANNNNGDISSKSSTGSISAIVDHVVEQFDTATNERPTTSWRDRNLKSSHGRNNNNNVNGNDIVDDEDFFLDANIDEMLPD